MIQRNRSDFYFDPRVVFPQRQHGVWSDWKGRQIFRGERLNKNSPPQFGTSASTRSGLPEPPLIFSGAEKIIAPVGGS